MKVLLILGAIALAGVMPLSLFVTAPIAAFWILKMIFNILFASGGVVLGVGEAIVEGAKQGIEDERQRKAK